MFGTTHYINTNAIYYEYMGELTTISKNSTKFNSLKTVVPMNIIKQWNLKEGDKIDWQWEARDNEMTLIVRKAK